MTQGNSSALLYSLSLQTTAVTYNKISLKILLCTNVLPNVILKSNVIAHFLDWVSLLWSTCELSNNSEDTEFSERGKLYIQAPTVGLMHSYNILHLLVTPRHVLQDYGYESFGLFFRFISISIFPVIFWKFQPFHSLWPAMQIKIPIYLQTVIWW